MTTDGASPDRLPLVAMKTALAHRGPDGDGVHVSGGVGMVHTRLAIIDLDTGDQPIMGPGAVALVANGEIYNFIELREQLADVRFATRSDCEPPLHLYARDGIDFADRLRGMYAIAIHDPIAGRLVLARDPFGIKPLYYAETPGAFVFASEPQAMVRAGLVTPRVRRERAIELLQRQFTTGRETVLDGVLRVLPGETLVIENGRIADRRLKPALSPGGPAAWDEDEALERLDAAFTDSVTVHQRSDVPYGMFLSGGIDSSAVLAMMAQLNDRPVRAFTVGFSGTGVADERDHAKSVAKALGAEHVEVEFDEAEFWRLLPRVAAAVDDPAADYAMLPTYKLAEQAGKDMKVILSGEGGDELFAGYGRYRRAMRPRWLGGRPMRARGMLDRFGILRDDVPGPRQAANEPGSGRTRLQAAQEVDCAGWLPNDLLIKLDRCLMAHGVEGRTPFLDPEVARVAMLLPDRLKVRRRLGKWVLRKWLDQRAPVAQPFSRKRGFTVPVGEWIAARGAELGPLVAEQPGVTELCRADAVRDVFTHGGKGAAFAAWTLLFYALWHQRHVLGHICDGDAIEALTIPG